MENKDNKLNKINHFKKRDWKNPEKKNHDLFYFWIFILILALVMSSFAIIQINSNHNPKQINIPPLSSKLNNGIFTDYGLDYFTSIGKPCNFDSDYCDLSSFTGSGHESTNLANGYLYVNITSSGGSGVYTYFNSIDYQTFNFSLYYLLQIRAKANESGLLLTTSHYGTLIGYGAMIELTTSFITYNLTFNSSFTLSPFGIGFLKRGTDSNFQGNESFVIDSIKLYGSNTSISSDFPTYYNSKGIFSITNTSYFPNFDYMNLEVNNEIKNIFYNFDTPIELYNLPESLNNLTLYIYDTSGYLISLSNTINFQNIYSESIHKTHNDGGWFFSAFYDNARFLWEMVIVFFVFCIPILGLVIFRRNMKK